MESAQQRMMGWRTTAYVVWAIIGMLGLLFAAGTVISRIAGALAPFLLAFVIVFLLQGPVNALVTRGVKRSLAVAVCFLAGLLALSIVLVFLVPPLTRQLVDFVTTIRGYLPQAETLVRELQARFSEVVVPQWLRSATVTIVGSLSQVFARLGNTLAQGILNAGSGVATVFFDLFLGAVIAFWTLKDLPTIRLELRAVVGERYEDDLENLIETINRVVGGYLKGQTIVSLVTGVAALIGLALFGIPYALVLGIITGVLNFIPYIGPLIAAFFAAVVALFLVGPVQALVAIAVIIGAQQLADLFVAPRVMSDQVDLHPTLVVFSLLVGGSLFGFMGMILAIPVAATAKGLFVYYYERKTKRQLATEDGALFKTPSCDDESDEPCEDSAETPGAITREDSGADEASHSNEQGART